ncbi:MAG: leucyl/phenylalanyl-tRNA--protein transferase [Proteobacteria bacterium]|nr:leucyl/phenylalanyl-tRNA--protein transferase [Pseudomonadota bacterium]
MSPLTPKPIPLELSPAYFIFAYRKGYFPMSNEDHTKIEWYLPDDRAVMFLDKFHVSRSLGRVIKKRDFEISFNHQFLQVMKACANRPETWISPDLIDAFQGLFELGYAESVEVTRRGVLVGGVYGVRVEKAFFAESMFHRESNMSKVALWALVTKLKQDGFTFFDCQMMSEHLKSLGAETLTNTQFQSLLASALSAR